MKFQKRALAFVIICLVVGIAVGLAITLSKPSPEEQAATRREAAPIQLLSQQDDIKNPAYWTARRSELTALLAADPGDLEAMIELGFCDMSMGRDTSAVEIFTRVVAEAEVPKLLIKAGLNLMRAGEPARALAAYEKALGYAPRDSEALYLASLAAGQTRDGQQKAREYMKRYHEVTSSQGR